MTRIALRGGNVIGPSSVERCDVLIDDGRIVQVGVLDNLARDVTQVDATGCWVGPGFVDLHTHLREPGRESAETIESGARAGAVGGYSALVAMPNTEPALDNVALVSYVLDRGMRSVLDVCVAGAITIGRKGESLAPMAEMAELGVRLFTDDGVGVQDPLVMRRALTYARPLGVRLAQHCEDEKLAAGGSMNEGAISSRLGLIGRPALAEELMVLRDIELVRLTKARLHFLHLSTARSVALAREAREQGLPITFEVAPHHFTLDETSCESFDPLFKVHPPLRARSDVEALREALQMGVVDAVATDHAPHAPETKDLAFDDAPAGMLGLEHAASLTYEALGSMPDPLLFFSLLSRGPARIAQLRSADTRVRHFAHGGDIKVGEDANIVVFDPEVRWTAQNSALHGKSLNNPYDGRELLGKVRTTIAKGALVVHEGSLV